MKWSFKSQESFLSYFRSSPLQDISERREYKDGLDLATAHAFRVDCIDRLGGSHGVHNPFLHDLMTDEDKVWTIVLNVLSVMRKKQTLDEENLRMKHQNYLKAEKEERCKENEWIARVNAEARRQLNEEKTVEEMVRFNRAVAARKEELRRMAM